MGLMKIGLFITNIVVALVGLGLTACASHAMVLTHSDGFAQLGSRNVNHIFFNAFILFAVGIFLCLMAITSCCATEKGGWLAITYSIVLVIGLIVCCVSVWIGFKEKESFAERLGNDIDKLYAGLTNQKNREVAVKLQKTLHCCGANGPVDWKIAKDAFPPNCCRNPDKNCFYNSKVIEEQQGNAAIAQYFTGCKEPAVKQFESILFFSPIALLVTIAAQFYALIFITLMLCCLSRSGSYSVV